MFTGATLTDEKLWSAMLNVAAHQPKKNVNTKQINLFVASTKARECFK